MNKTAAHRFSTFATSNKKRVLKRITLNLTSDEAKNLEKYCEQTGKAATDLIRELIEALPVT
ncbi:MAG: CopG family transcriptional regulator [Hassallia sp. WJT32-NPBG1]|jgi:chemotaxis methyl-accepting protein methylase|nr:CopG family transcriptional regulator [Tolypothrix sp. Co-bin9]MBD0302033.1 CopG family transcriptional regulator [Tolypothrix sp. T3-bin4]MBW4446730.1 CopG family transcriptional regulator [Spirirestis rafaelensis WJT71-NPBG6]MBW4606552.1 CopG family transcriptional regulator [Hassallia sp. WJT32-NPBG1]